MEAQGLMHGSPLTGMLCWPHAFLLHALPSTINDSLPEGPGPDACGRPTDTLCWPHARVYGQLCTPYNGDDLIWHPVALAMSRMDYQEPDCSKPLKRQSIAKFFKPVAAPGVAQTSPTLAAVSSI